jgi:hypothetical protein
MQDWLFVLDQHYTIQRFNYIIHISVIHVINKLNCVSSLIFII